MNSFDSKAKDWDANKSNLDRTEVIAKAIAGKACFKPGTAMLEFGCGTGLLSFALRARLGRITLLDSSPGMIETLKDKIKASGSEGMDARLCDLSGSVPPDEKYGMVCSQMALHHVRDIRGVLGKFHALLEDGGILFIADLDKEDGSFHKTAIGFDGHNGFDRVELASMAEAAGFKNVEFETVYEILKEIDGAVRSYPVFLMKAES